MYPQLLSHSPDLARLLNEGYEVEIKENYLFIHNVPYVNQRKEIQRGTFVSTLNLANKKAIQPETHVISFKGDFPCDKNGNPLENIRHQTQNEIKAGFTTNHSFSNKPPDGFKDYYEKVTSYIHIVSAPAFSLDKSATAKNFKPIKYSDDESVFNYFDSNSSRSGTLELNDVFKKEIVAIVGTGGTGSYVLDTVSKTPVKEIHLFDGKKFIHHNAFRSPGAASIEELTQQPFKTDYYQARYSNIHRGIFSHPENLDKNNISKLKNMTFVFICIDDPAAKKTVISFLIENKIKFIDVGMGIEVVDKKLRGTVRVTTGLFEKNDHIAKRVSFENGPEDDYHSNIQTSDLNGLNAFLAVIKWKKLLGYYHDFENEHNSLYDIDGNHLTNDEKN